MEVHDMAATSTIAIVRINRQRPELSTWNLLNEEETHPYVSRQSMLATIASEFDELVRDYKVTQKESLHFVDRYEVEVYFHDAF